MRQRAWSRIQHLRLIPLALVATLTGCDMIAGYSTTRVIPEVVDSGVDARGVDSRVVDGLGVDTGADLGALACGGELTGFAYRKVLTVDKTQVQGAHRNFPLLVQLSGDSDLKRAQPSGADLRFFAGQHLDFEIEQIDTAKGQLTAWVRLPELSSTRATSLCLVFGDPAAKDGQNAQGVWREYAGVFHLAQSAAKDSSAAALATTTGASLQPTPGKAGPALFFSGGKISFVRVDDPPLPANTSFTLQAWFRPKTLNFNNRLWWAIVSKGRFSNRYWFGIWLKPGNLLTFGWTSKDAGGNVGSVPVSKGQWHHAVVVFASSGAGSERRLYYDGTLKARSTGGSYKEITEQMLIGKDPLGSNTASPSYFDGTIDEVRFAKVARSVDWIATEYRNQDDPSSFVKVGPLQRQR